MTTDFVAVSDIADMAGVGNTAVSNWIARFEDFPEPDHIVARGEIKVWRSEHVVAWLAAHGRVPILRALSPTPPGKG